jgi:IclR family transcriptional regulator, pca regulon regulatory protein
MMSVKASERPVFAKSEYVQTLERGIAVILSFDEERPRQTLAEVAAATKMSRAAARRFLLTLNALGYVGYDGKYFTLLPKALQIGYAYLASIPWWRHAHRVAERLARQLEHPCAIAVLDGDAIAYVAYAPPVNFPTVRRSIGTRQPVHATAIGHALLSGMPDEKLREYLSSIKLSRYTPFTLTTTNSIVKQIDLVRERGFAQVNQHLEIGLHSLGVPVRGRDGSVVAGLSIGSGVAWPALNELKKRELPALWEAAQAITDCLPS